MPGKNEIHHAELSWSEDTPHNANFNDVYFSTDSGCEESEYVFLKHNHLPTSWCDKRHYVIAETGFGTGLNFLLTAQRWMQTKTADSHLTFYSVEKFPLSLPDLKKANTYWPEFSSIADHLQQAYPGNIPGFHTIQFEELSITLVLMIGDVLDMIPQMNCVVNSWYLDGFAPAKNPDMWSEQVMAAIASKSCEGTRFSTFTAAGFVRRNLIATGFDVQKQVGFGRKREMLCGEMLSNPDIEKRKNPWFELPQNASNKPDQAVVIIGAGLAGLSCAWVLAQQGIKSVVIDADNNVAAGASGNPAGIVLPRFTMDMNVESQFYLSGFLSSVAWFDFLKDKIPELQWFKSGVVQIESSHRLEKIKKLGMPAELLEIMDQLYTEKNVGIALNNDVIHYPSGGYVNPKQLCELLYHSAENMITLRLNTDVARLEYQNQQWLLLNTNGEHISRANSVILANGFAAAQLLNTGLFTVGKNRGQLSFLVTNAEMEKLKKPVCHQGYVIPVIEGMHCVGATYATDDSVDLSKADHQQNITAMQNMFDGKYEIDCNNMAGRVSFRTTSLDHLPVVGPVMDEVFYRDAYADIRHGKTPNFYPQASYLPGLYINVAHGSRGLVSCYPSAQYISALITGQALTLAQNVIEKLHPARFLIRELKKAGGTS